MKKTFFYYAAVALVVLCNISCSSDDEEDDPITNKNEVQLEEPEAAATAAAFEIPTTSAVTATGASGTETLDAVNFTESGKAVLTIGTADDEVKYATFDTSVQKLSENKTRYNLKDGTKDVGYIIATVESTSLSRGAEGNVVLEIYLTVEIPEVGTLTFNGTVNNAEEVNQTANNTTNLTNICRTWNVVEITMSLKGDVDCTLSEKTNNLLPFAQKAQDNDAQLTYDEYKEFCRSVYGITLDKTGLFSIEYQNASGQIAYKEKQGDARVQYIECDGKKSSEVCSWQWIDSNETGFRLKFRKADFGNKFLNENSRIGVKFYDTGIAHFSITTKITGKKNYDATIDFTLK